jgi:hypothetical protein
MSPLRKEQGLEKRQEKRQAGSDSKLKESKYGQPRGV